MFLQSCLCVPANHLVDQQLRELGEANASLEQYAILKFAEALEVIPRILLDNSGVDSTHAVASLVAAHQKVCGGFSLSF